MTERDREERVLVLAPTARDGEATRMILEKAGIACAVCIGLEEVCSEIDQGVGAAILTQESILADKAGRLSRTLERQPSWSDFPLVVLTPAGPEAPSAVRSLEAIGHMTLVKRPVTILSLLSTMRAAIRDRRRQYALRDHLLKLAEQETALKEADRRKNEFLAMLAHELRNPLAAIRNAVEGAIRSPNEADTAWSLAVIGRQVDNFSHLIDDLLDVSRITQGKIRLRRRSIDAVSVVHHAAEAVRPLVIRREHELNLSFGSPELWTEADPTRLEQIMVNLLTNAAKYTPRGGRIDVVVGLDGGEVSFRVKDNGVGIAPESLAGMFELFAQSDRSLARSEGGLGIGLTLVKSLAEMHEGSVSATSGGVGLGSEFIVRLPAASRPIAGADDAKPKGMDRTERGRRILVVDDNADSARGMARLLQLVGHSLDVAYDGTTAIESARAFRPDAIILDIGLPGIDGYEVARRIRREDWGGDVLIVAVSGYGQDRDRSRAMDSGIDHHLTKPVEFDALTRLLDGGQTG